MSYNTVLGACQATGDIDRALGVLEEMKNSGRRFSAPNVWSYNVVLATCAGAGEWSTVERLLREMDTVFGKRQGARFDSDFYF